MQESERVSLFSSLAPTRTKLGVPEYTKHQNKVCLDGNQIPDPTDAESCSSVCSTDDGTADYHGCGDYPNNDFVKNMDMAYCVNKARCQERCDESDDCLGFDVRFKNL